jgi:hypothetical protein
MRLGPHCLFAVTMLLTGCDKDSASSDDKPSEAGGSSSSKSSGGKAKSAEVPAIVTDEVVRLADARAIIALPELPDGWTIIHKQNPMMTGMQLFRGTPKDFSAFVTVVFPTSKPGRTPEALHAEFVESLRLAPLVAGGPAASFEIPGGLANSWSSPSGAAVAERGWAAVIVQDNEAVTVFARSQAGIFDNEVLPLAKRLLTGLRLGSKVPRLGDNKPSERLEGVWEYKSGLETEWMIFDPRGYAYLGSPDDPSELDFDVLYALGKRLFKYQIANGEIVLERFPPDAEDVVRRWKFAHQGDALLVAGQEYRRVDDAKVELPPGKWEAYQSYDMGNAYTGSTGIAVDDRIYAFAPDGTYTYTGGFSYMHAEMDVGNPGNIDWSASGYAAPEPAKGKWKIEGNMLVLDDGKVVAKRMVFPSAHSPGRAVYIGGVMFLLKKD